MTTSLNLANYVRIGRYDLPEPTRTKAPDGNLLGQEVSGVTYNSETGTLFIVGDGGTYVTQVSTKGALIDTMTLAKGSSPQGTEFYDPEGIAHVGGTTFVMVEERDRQAVQFTYQAGTTLARGDASTVVLGTDIGNVGLEGMTYDPQTGGFIFVKEIDPQGIFQTTIDFKAGTASNGSATTANSTNLFDPAGMKLGDIADVFSLSNVALFDGKDSGANLLVLSQQDGRIVEVTRSGEVVGTLQIRTDLGNPLSVADQQHEGLAMDDAGNLYVVSENGGGDFDHPQLWVYAPATVPNSGATALTLQNALIQIEENSDTTARLPVAELVFTDDGLGQQAVFLEGADADAFEVENDVLYLKAGTKLDFETQSSYSISMFSYDPSLDAPLNVTASYSLTVTDIANEGTTLPTVYVSEIAPWSSGNSAVGADWFEITNGSAAALDITGWRMDDSSAVFEQGAPLSGVTTLAPGESAIFIEGADTKAAADAFVATWFGGTLPAGLQIGSYSGKGVGLSTGGDAVNLYNAAGELQTGVTFGASPAAAPFATFSNAAALNGVAVTTLSAQGVNGAFKALGGADEIGSPGTVGRLFISEIAPWSSGSSPVKADWFELTNGTAFTIDLAGWKMDDSSGSPAAAVALNGVASIAPGESVVFIESANPAAATKAFLSNWFGDGVPAGLQIGTYTGAGVGLSSGGDGVHIYDSGNTLRAAISFGASPEGPYPTFENSSALNGTGVTISTLSASGSNGAFAAVNSAGEIGSPFGQQPLYTLQILHASDFEAGLKAIDRAPRFAAIVDKLEDAYTNSITLASGDNYIPSPFLIAQGDPSLKAPLITAYSKILGVPEATLASLGQDLGRVDMAIMNALGVQASVFGNHEFDLGTRAVSTAIDMTASSGKATSIGAQFPYLSANLDFSGDSDLAPLFTADLRDAASYATTAADLEAANIAAEASDRQIAPWTTISEGGQTIGVLGVTTQVLAAISSVGGVKVMDPAGDGGKNNTTELASILQPLVNQMTGQGINKVILLSHLQDYTLELDLATKLSGVDVIIAGGSHAVFADETDTLVDGVAAAQGYPVIRTGADGNPVAVVNTGGEYYNLGRLVVSFDAQGVIVPASVDPAVSGAYVATDATVGALYGAEDPYAAGSRGGIVKDLVTAVDTVIDAKLGVVAGFANVYLQGQRAFVRSQETNFGNLTADANLAAARVAAPAVAVSLKNGGGIREGIGTVGTGAIPSYEAPADGRVTQLDIENALRFNNRLMVFDTTPQGLLNILNYAASRPAGNGGFAQLGGLRFSFDPDLPTGQQVRSVALYDLDGSFVTQVVANGQVVAGAPATITAVTLNFIANGGDGYPIKANAENFRYLLSDGTASPAIDEALDFTAAANVPANALGEQQAFTSYMAANHGTPETAFAQAETPASQDLRIENLNLRGDAVLAGAGQVFTVAAQDARLAEGDAGETEFTFVVSRSGNTEASAEIGWSVAGAAGPGTAPANAQDFAGGVLPSGVVSFAPGQTSRTVTVSVAGDTAGEAHERFAMSLGTLPQGAAFAGGTAHGVILTDDTSFSIGPVQANRAEGNGSGTTDFTFLIHRNGIGAVEQSVAWSVAGAAVPGSLAADAADFAGGALPAGTVTFAPGETSKLVTVPVLADGAIEQNEHFVVSLSGATGGATIGRATARGDILNDDGSRYSIGPAIAMVAEGTGGSTSAIYTVYRAGASAGTDTLDWAVSPGSTPGTLPAGAADFAGGVLPSGTVTFAPGQRTATIQVDIAADAQREFNESFTVALSNPSAGAAIGRGTAKGAIIDDDTIFVLGGGPVSGTGAADYFLIGPGTHEVSGLGGVDRFVFAASVATASGPNATTLPDFAAGLGERIDLRPIDAIAGSLANDAFTFIGAAAFTGTPGELRAELVGTVAMIAGDTNGDGVANFEIHAFALQAPQANWFLV
jgi:uncharacterized protein YjiK/2',3'-cyclic-nucleotide 2'-phosphodiesterase (5'-nucleotidase family)